MIALLTTLREGGEKFVIHPSTLSRCERDRVETVVRGRRGERDIVMVEKEEVGDEVRCIL